MSGELLAVSGVRRVLKCALEVGDRSTDRIAILEGVGKGRRLHVTQTLGDCQLDLDFSDRSRRDRQEFLYSPGVNRACPSAMFDGTETDARRS